DKGTIPIEDLIPGIKQAVNQRRIFPIFVYSGLFNIGTQNLVESIVEYLPPPTEDNIVIGINQNNGKIERQVSDQEPLSAYVFKTLVDQFSGRLSFLKVYSGIFKADSII